MASRPGYRGPPWLRGNSPTLLGPQQDRGYGTSQNLYGETCTEGAPMLNFFARIIVEQLVALMLTAVTATVV